MELSILVPSRDEELLEKTIEDILLHIEGETEVLVGLDGWSQPIGDEDLYLAQFKYKGKVHFVKSVKGIGQRAITNALAKASKAKYLLKCDSHVSFQQGFDKIMVSEMDNRTILAPLMGVLEPNSWTINGNKMTSRYGFDTNLIMQYLPNTEELETPCLQGSAFMINKENYFKWGLDDESLGSWGQQGVQLGILAYLNGGRCLTTRNAYFGHVFRHTDADFPYDRGSEPGKFANEEMKRRYLNQSIAGLIRKYNYFCDWTPKAVEALPNML